MTAIDEFKEKLKAGELFDALTIAMSEAIELKVTTWVSSSESESEEPQAGNCLRTRINLVDGAVENEIGSEFIGNEAYRELQQFHLEQVREGREILLKNLESLQKMFVVLSNTMSQLPQTPVKQLQPEKNALSPYDREN